jgi:site-specific recombinase XerD
MFDGTNYTGTAIRGRRFPRETLTEDECKALLARCSRRSATGIRNRALIVVLWRAGLRISEALALRPADVDDTGSELIVLSGKGGKRRLVPLDGGAMAEVLRWRDRRETLEINGHRPLFCTLEGGQLSASYVRQLLRRLGEAAGIEKRIHPHAFRHTYAAELVRDGIPMPEIRDALGHSSLATTDTYLKELQPGLDRLRSRPSLTLDDD